VTIEATAIDGLLVVRWPTYADDRGFFRQTYQLPELAEALGRTPEFVQGNHARSRPGVLRGFHAEPWDKLVQVSRGTVLAAVADIRPDSGTFGTAVSIPLGDDPGERMRLFVSAGLANAYCAYGDGDADYLYEVTALYDGVRTHPTVAWDDPDLGVRWPVDAPIVSDADRGNPTLRELFPDHARWRGSGPVS